MSAVHTNQNKYERRVGRLHVYIDGERLEGDFCPGQRIKIDAAASYVEIFGHGGTVLLDLITPEELGALPASGDRLYLRLPRPASTFVFPSLVAAASALVVVGAVVWLWDREPPRRVLAGAFLSTSDEPLKSSDTAASFRSGELLFLHLNVHRSSVVFVAFLDSEGGLSLVSDTPEPVDQGTRTFGPYPLDNKTGVESFIVLAGNTPLALAVVSARIEEAKTLLKSLPKSTLSNHRSVLSSVLESLGSHGDLDVIPVTFEHRP